MSKLISIVCCCLFFFVSIGADDLTPIVSISDGPIQGKFVDFVNSKVAHFLGIPYAKPPVKSLRFQAPEKPEPWTETKSVVEYGSSCAQRSKHIKPEQTSEDCLYLNVYVTQSTLNSSSTRLRPVLFWIHGGALAEGSGNEFYQGLPMVPLRDVILVTHNYRLNAFGFMYFGQKEPRIPGNIGLRDQLLALQWVQENIARFGGDPNQVTIFGESAGSMAISAHLLSPLSKGLFKRAILQSGTIMTPIDDQEFFIQNAWRVLNRTLCASSTDILACLQGLEVPEIIDNQSDGLLRFRWIYGDDFLPYSPKDAFSQGLYDNSVDLLIGAEKNEFSVFMTLLDSNVFNPFTPVPLDYKTAVDYLSLVFKPEALDFYSQLYFGSSNDSDSLRSQLERAFSDISLLCPTYVFGSKYKSNGDNIHEGQVFAYYHTQKPSLSILPICDSSKWMGTCHGSDIPHVFGFPLVTSSYSENDVHLSIEMMKIWTKFAEFGKPPTVAGTEWKPMNEDKSAIILNIADLGKLDHERIEFCERHWENFTIYGSLQLTYIVSAS